MGGYYIPLAFDILVRFIQRRRHSYFHRQHMNTYDLELTEDVSTCLDEEKSS